MLETKKIACLNQRMLESQKITMLELKGLIKGCCIMLNQRMFETNNYIMLKPKKITQA